LKDARIVEVNRNQEVRNKIQAQVEEYKKAEENYQSKIKFFQEKMGQMQERFKGDLDDRI